MAALAAAVRPFAGGVLPRRAATAPSDASERASGKKLPRVVAPARDPSVCLAGVEELYVPSQNQKRKMMTCNRNNVIETAAADTKVLTVVGGGEMSARELLQKRLACELEVLRGLLKKAELVSRRGGPCNGGGAPTAGKKVRFLASNSKQRSEPMEDGGGGGNAPSVMKRRKISALVEQKQKQVRAPPPRMSEEERSQLAGRLSSLSGKVPGHIVEFVLNHCGDADAGGEIEVNIDSVQDSELFEIKTELDKFARERPSVVGVFPEVKDDEKLKLAEDIESKGILEQEVKTGSRPSSRTTSGSDTGSYYDRKINSDEFPADEALPNKQIIAMSAQPPPSSEPAPGAARSGEAKTKSQDVQRAAAAAPKTVSLAVLIYRAKVRRELLEMERAALPVQSIHRWDLQRLGIAEYGRPSLMRQLGLFLKADDA